MSPLPPPEHPPPIPVDPSLVSHQGAGPRVNAVSWSLFSICTLFLAVRLYAKKVRGNGFWWDDWIVLASWVVHLVACILLSVMCTRGFGEHPWDYAWGIDPRELVFQWVRNTLTMTAAAWSKTAFAVTLLRLSTGWLRWFVWFILVSMNVIIALNATINWVGCEPIQRSWDPTVPGTCKNILPQIIFIGNLGGGYSGACDIVLAILPWAIIWKLQMKPREKLGVGIAMSLGLVAGIMALIKTAHLVNLSTGDTYDAAILNIWDSAEVSVTIIAASIPTLRVLFRDAAVSASDRYYGGQSDAQTPSNGVSKNGHFFSIGARSSRTRALQKTSTGSDESILSPVTANGSKILRVDEYTMKHGNNSTGDVDERNTFEMRDR